MTNTANVCINLKEEVKKLSKLVERLETLQVAIEELNKDLTNEGFTTISLRDVENRINIVQDYLMKKLLEAYRTGCLIWVDNDA